MHFKNLIVLGCFLLLIISNSVIQAQENYQVLNWKAGNTLNTYLMNQMHRQYEIRDSLLNQALQSPRALTNYRNKLNSELKGMLGQFPEKNELKAKSAGTVQQDGYRVEKIIYQSQPQHYVTANLYLPEGKGPFPGILLMCGHENDAKVSPFNQTMAGFLALNGFVVLVTDPVSQGERHQLFGADRKPLTRGGTTEHTILNAGANLLGTSVAAHELWDNIRSIDYLVNRPEVDPNQIGCLGSSGGGTQTTYLAAVDDRIRVAAPGSYVTRREINFLDHGADDGCQHLLGEGAGGFEISDFLILFAPKPLLIHAGEYDFVNFHGTREAFKELKQVYRVLDHPEQVKLFAIQDGHGMGRAKREAVVKWFRKWFYGDDAPVTEPVIAVLPSHSLTCTRTGQVMLEFEDARSVSDLLQIKAEAVRPGKKLNREDLAGKIKYRIGNEDSDLSFHAETRGSENEGGFEKIILRSPDEVPLPVLKRLPESDIKKVWLVLSEKDKGLLADSLFLHQKADREGIVLILSDLPGLGETTDPAAANDPKFYNREYRNAITAIHTGTSVVAIRTSAILRLVEYVFQEQALAELPLEIFASGSAAVVPALQATALNSRINRLTIKNSICSFVEVLDQPEKKDWYSIVVPGVLKEYDVPDLKMEIGVRLVEELMP